MRGTYGVPSEPAIQVNPLAVDFGSVVMGVPAAETVTIVNDGGAELDIEQILTTGDGADAFAISGSDAPFTLAPGGNSSVTVAFDPAGTGSFAANLAIQSNDPGIPVLEIPLSGVAAPFVPGARITYQGRLMEDGEIVYLRGFGYLTPPAPLFGFPGVPMPENALVRLASVTKPATAAAVRRVLADHDDLDENSPAFDINGDGSGALPVNPTGGTVEDSRVRNITIDHLLRHRGGWDRDEDGVPDWTYRECVIASDLGVSSPPGRVATLDWILGEQPLEFTPGSDAAYSNIGYLALGLLVEHLSGQDLMTYVWQNVLTPSIGVPWHEIRQGRTFRSDGFAREPWYRHPHGAANVFDDCNSSVSNAAYGAWDHEARIGQGGMVATAATMLTLAHHYHIGRGHFSYGTNIGMPRDEVPLGSQNQVHGGVLRGSNAILYQRTDDINVFIFFNERDYVVIPSSDPSQDDTEIIYAEWMRRLVRDTINAGGFAWPETTSDGFWVKPETEDGGGIYAQGGYHAPLNGMGDAVTFLSPGSKVRVVPGNGTSDFDWTGTIDKRMTLDAPEGTVRIGQ